MVDLERQRCSAHAGFAFSLPGDSVNRLVKHLVSRSDSLPVVLEEPKDRISAPLIVPITASISKVNSLLRVVLTLCDVCPVPCVSK